MVHNIERKTLSENMIIMSFLLVLSVHDNCSLNVLFLQYECLIINYHRFQQLLGLRDKAKFAVVIALWILIIHNSICFVEFTSWDQI